MRRARLEWRFVMLSAQPGDAARRLVALRTEPREAASDQQPAFDRRDAFELGADLGRRHVDVPALELPAHGDCTQHLMRLLVVVVVLARAPEDDVRAEQRERLNADWNLGGERKERPAPVERQRGEALPGPPIE